jgi:hypothetical protein
MAVLTTDYPYSPLTIHFSIKNSLHPARANTREFLVLWACSPPANASAPHPPPRTSAALRSCLGLRCKRASPGKRPRCHSSSKAGRSESFLRSLSLTLTVEARTKRVNPSNLAFCAPFTALFSSEQILRPTLRSAHPHGTTASRLIPQNPDYPIGNRKPSLRVLHRSD